MCDGDRSVIGQSWTDSDHAPEALSHHLGTHEIKKWGTFKLISGGGGKTITNISQQQARARTLPDKAGFDTRGTTYWDIKATVSKGK